MRGARQIAALASGAVAATLLLAAPSAARAQPDWLPPEVQPRPRSPFGEPAAADPDDPCRDPLFAPIAPPVRDSGFDGAASGCLRARWSLTARGGADLDTPEGDLAAGALFLDLSRLLLRDLEIAAGARAVVTRYAEIDTSDDDDLDAGPVYLAATGALATYHPGGHPLRLAWRLRLDLPWTDTTWGDTAVVAASPQIAASLGLAPAFAIHGRIAALLWVMRPPDDVETRRAVLGSTDLVFAPWRVLAVSAGAEAQAGWYESGLDHLLVRGGLRVPFGCRARLHLGAAFPLAGDEPTDAVGELSFTHDW